MKRSIFTLLLSVLLLFPLSNFSANISFNVTDGSGNASYGDWSSINSWDLGRIPVAGDIITIPANFTVIISSQINLISNDCTPSALAIYGTLHFIDNGPKLRMGCNEVLKDCISNVTVHAGGKITADKYNGNSNFIDLCNNNVWIASDGPVTVPTTFTDSPLPVELTAFNAINKGPHVELFWSTASESNNDYFSIERSVNGVDFEVIGELTGAGNSNRTLNYSFTDQSPLKGVVYYRLKQTDFNLDYAYSKLVTVKSEVSKEQIFKLYPNPVNKSESINLYTSGENSGDIKISVYNTYGRLVYNHTLNNATNTEVSLDFHHSLPKGSYFITFISENKAHKKKLIVKD